MRVDSRWSASRSSCAWRARSPARRTRAGPTKLATGAVAPSFERSWSSDDAWTPLTIDQATAQISDAVVLGAPVAVYATSGGGTKADSAHLVHREGSNQDGAIVLAPGAASSRSLLFAFSDQTF